MPYRLLRLCFFSSSFFFFFILDCFDFKHDTVMIRFTVYNSLCNYLILHIKRCQMYFVLFHFLIKKALMKNENRLLFT